jgi:tetratricopeptide (TPR) repeat protein
VTEMSLRDWVSALVGPKPASGAAETDCLDETEVIGLSEGRFRGRKLARAEKHLVRCSDCRESVALMVKASRDGAAQPAEEISDLEIRNQTARVLGYIDRDRTNRSTSREVAKARGSWLSYPQLAAVALVVCAAAAVSVFFLTQDETPEAAGMKALALAVESGRQTPAMVSGLSAHSEHATTRGVTDSSSPQFESAFNKLKFGEQDTAPVDSRIAFARVCLSMNTTDRAREAKSILEQLLAAGFNRPDLLNDLGVAEFELDNYDQAINYFTRSLVRSPKYPPALFNRALAREQMGLTAEAANDWQEFITVAPDEGWKSEANSHLSGLNAPTK